MDIIEKNQIVTESIARQLQIYGKARKKIKLSDTEEVQRMTEGYLDSCATSGTYPSISGLSACLGVSRQALWKYCQSHNDATTDFLGTVRDMIADVLQDSALKGTCNPIAGIFLLKNLGYSDKVDLTIDGIYTESLPTTSSLINKYSNTVIADSID